MIYSLQNFTWQARTQQGNAIITHIQSLPTYYMYTKTNSSYITAWILSTVMKYKPNLNLTHTTVRSRSKMILIHT